MTGMDQRALKALLPHPAADANKYTRGKLILAVGSKTYPGAALLASVSAQRMGAGYCEAFTDPANVQLMQSFRPSLVVRSFQDLMTKGELQASDDHHPVAYLVGSGFDAEDSVAQGALRRVLGTQTPVLIDGGALGMLASLDLADTCYDRGASGQVTVLTPHGGEAARLAAAAGMDNFAQLDQRVQAAALAKSYGAVVVLKGPDTVISDGMDSYVMTEGTSALAKAGTGDVLAGIISALLAQGMDAFDACVLGTTVHARAGIEAARQVGPISACPEDVVSAIPTVLMEIDRETAAHLGFMA